MTRRAFTSTGKIVVRDLDLAMIAKLAKKAGRKLSYLGLPSPWMGDVETWSPFLEQIYAVEQNKIYLPHLMDKAYTLGVHNQVTYFLGDIDTILSSKVDNYGRSIEQVFPIDIVNLDYCGGLDYKEFSVLATLDELIREQANSLKKGKKLPSNFPYFVIFLTHNIPENEGNPVAKEKYLKFLIRDLDQYKRALIDKTKIVIEWYLSENCPSAYQPMYFVIGKTLEYAQTYGFKVTTKKVIQYIGDKEAVMLHYQFRFVPIDLRSPVPVDSKIKFADILDYPVVNENGEDIAVNRPLIKDLQN